MYISKKALIDAMRNIAIVRDTQKNKNYSNFTEEDLQNLNNMVLELFKLKMKVDKQRSTK